MYIHFLVLIASVEEKIKKVAKETRNKAKEGYTSFYFYFLFYFLVPSPSLPAVFFLDPSFEATIIL